MNKNGEKTKLLAAVAVLAMIMCVFAVAAIPSSDAVTGDEFLDGADANGVITLDADVTVSSVITVTGALTINGNGHTITADSNASWTGDGDKNILSIENVGATVTINNVTFDSANTAYGLNIDSRSNIENNNVVLNDVTVKNSKGTGLTVNDNSNAEVNDSTFSNNSWGDINVDKASTLNIDDATELTSNFQIWSEDVTAAENPSVINADSYVGYRWDKTGNDAVTDGRAYFKNGNVPADITLTSQTLTVAEGQALYIVGGSTGVIPTGITNNGVIYTIPEGTTGTVNGNTVSISGTAAIADLDASGADWNGLFDGVTTSWSIVGIAVTLSDYESVDQTNPAMNDAYPKEDGIESFPDDKKTTTLTGDETGSYWFLIPTDGSSVSVTFNGKDSNADLALTFNFNVENKATVPDADSANDALADDNISEVTIDGSKLTSSTTPIVVPANKTLVIENSTADSEFAINTVDGDKTQSAKFDGVIGNIVITKGSVVMYSPDMIQNGVVTVGAGTTLRIADGTSIDGVKFVGTDDKSIVEVPRSATVTFANTVTFDDVAVNLKGTVNGGTIQVEEGATVTIDGTVTSAFVNNGGKIVNNAPSLGDIELKDGTTVIDQTSINGALGQDITVTGEVTVAKGGHIISNGTLTIAEGAKLILEEGSYLAIGATGMVVNNGTIEVQTGTAAQPTFQYGGSSMDVSATGAIDFQGANSFANTYKDSTGTDISVAGTVTVGEDADVNITGVTVAATGKLYVYGAANGTFVNNGTTTIDSEAGCNVTVGMGDGAVLNLVNAVGTVAVNDKDMSFKYQNADKKISNPAEVTFQDVSGITVTDSLTTKVEKDETTADPDDTTRNGYGKLCISGAAGIASNVDDTLDKATITVVSGTVNVAEDATLSFVKGYTLTVNGTLAVAGSVDATAEETSINGTGTVDVTGKITSDDTIATTTTVNAAWYTSGTGKDAVNVYTSLATAIADGADDIDLLGNYKIAENITIPANVKVNANSAITVTVDKDVTVTVAFDSAANASGKLINSSKVITVNGTLIAQNYDKSGVVQNNVVCDVIVDNEPEKKFTSIYVALDEAVAGDVINITKTGTLTITEDIVIPEDVKLVVPSDCDVVVDDGVTVTVNGTYEGEGAYTMADPADPKDPTQTIVNGMFKVSNTWTDEMKQYVSGAFYSYDGFYVISPLSVLSTVMADVESEDAKIYGTVTEGAVTLASEDDFAVVMTANANLTVTDLTLDGVKFDFTADKSRVNGTVTTADGSFALTNVMGGTITAETAIDGDNETTTATLAGNVVKTNLPVGTEDLTKTKASVTVTGTADVASATGFAVPMTVSKDAVVGISKAVFTGDVTVEGTLNVESAGVEFATMNVTGTVAVADKCDASVDTLYLGVSKNATTDVITDLGAGTISNVTVDRVAYVGPSASFTATEDQAEDGTNALEVTAYYAEDSLVVTAYANGKAATPAKISEITASVPNAYLYGWADEEGKVIGQKYDNVLYDPAVGATDCARVDAKVNYDIYVINLRADQNAISSISIDGNLMEFGMISTPGVNGGTDFYYGYTITVAAGSHTIQYQLANGYSGNGVLTVNGTQQSGLTFTTEGNPTDGKQTVTYNLQLNGFEKSGYVPDSPDTGSDSGDSGMTITDYLLIVLVVLIIVMAIIVAMRLMRS